MPAYPHEGETARIMALAPVIPVLTVASVEDGLAQAKALVAGGLYAIEVTLRTPSALAAIQAIAKNVPKRGRRRGHDRLGRADRPGGRGRGAVSGQPRRSRGARQGRGGVAGSVPAGLRDGLGSHGAEGAWLPGAEALSRRSGRGREAARVARRAPAGSALLPDRRHRSSEGARISEAAECALRRRVVDVAEGGAGGGRLSRGRSSVARRGGARAGGR